MKEFPRKFLSLRDKNGSHHRSKSVPPGHKDKAHPLSGNPFRAMFRMDGSKQDLKSQTLEIDQSKIDEVRQRLEKLNLSNVTSEYIKDVMASNIGEGDSGKTTEFIILEQKSVSGTILPYDPSVHMLGAENRGNVTCYLDSLLFAMFAKLDAFECMLSTTFPVDDPKFKLITLLRIWVNLLRSGKLIRTDLTKVIQDTLSDCGWLEAKLLEQQDTSEAFAFLSETLQLPLLSLQVDLFHQGKKDKDDHKVVYERLLNLAVPPDPEGRGIKLEDCLEEYFNAKVDVLRDHEEAKKTILEEKGTRDGSPLPSQTTVQILRLEDGATSSLAASPIDVTPTQQSFGDPIERSLSRTSAHTNPSITRMRSQEGSFVMANDQEDTTAVQRPAARTRSTSIIQRVTLDGDNSTMAKRAKRQGSAVVKAVTIPAWQFFRLIPWHALTPNEPRSDSEVALNFDQRPVVGICLKRYAMTAAGQPQRLNTFIDIPDGLRLPHFMLAGNPKLDEELNGLSTEYKLVLQSVVCHRGDSLQSGHYIAFARVAPKLLTDNRRHNFDPPPDYEEAQWVKFDDLETNNRIAYVDDIKQALRAEMPYLLFYQVVPMCDAAARASTDGTDAEPPSYNESKTSIDIAVNDLSSSEYGRLTGNHREELHSLDLGTRSKPPSIRLSLEADGPPRSTLDQGWSTPITSTPIDSPRDSLALADSPAITPDRRSPILGAVDESTASRLSRAASIFAIGRQSRSTSQSGEGRISLTMNRLGGFMKSGRDSLGESSNGLHISASNSTGPLSDVSVNKDPESPVDETGKQHFLVPQDKEREKQKHKDRRGKPKEKGKDRGKIKTAQSKAAGDQPERECSVM